MLLIPFIENSFKHSYIEDNGWIELKIETNEDKLLFNCKNSIPKAAIKKDEVGGVGLDNVKKRLVLIYPDQHRLEILQEDDCYSVILEIDI